MYFLQETPTTGCWAMCSGAPRSAYFIGLPLTTAGKGVQLSFLQFVPPRGSSGAIVPLPCIEEIPEVVLLTGTKVEAVVSTFHDLFPTTTSSKEVVGGADVDAEDVPKQALRPERALEVKDYTSLAALLDDVKCTSELQSVLEAEHARAAKSFLFLSFPQPIDDSAANESVIAMALQHPMAPRVPFPSLYFPVSHSLST